MSQFALKSKRFSLITSYLSFVTYIKHYGMKVNDQTNKESEAQWQAKCLTIYPVVKIKKIPKHWHNNLYIYIYTCNRLP